MSIPDSDKLARYDYLANLVEELHDENMALRGGYTYQATRHAELIASAHAMRAELEHLRLMIEEAVDYIPVNSKGAHGLVADMKAALANAKTCPQ